MLNFCLNVYLVKRTGKTGFVLPFRPPEYEKLQMLLVLLSPGAPFVYDEQCMLDEMFSALQFWDGDGDKCVSDAIKINILPWVRIYKKIR